MSFQWKDMCVLFQVQNYLFYFIFQLHNDKKQISVGLIGYPNVGKSSIINALKSKKVCNVAPIPGETKVKLRKYSHILLCFHKYFLTSSVLYHLIICSLTDDSGINLWVIIAFYHWCLLCLLTFIHFAANSTIFPLFYLQNFLPFYTLYLFQLYSDDLLFCIQPPPPHPPPPKVAPFSRQGIFLI